MRRGSAFLLVALATGCHSSHVGARGDGGSDEVLTAHGDFHHFVVNQIAYPRTRTDHALDLDGDGTPDNRLGDLFGLLGDAQPDVDRRVQSGATLLLVTVQTADPALQSDDQVGVTLARAEPQMNPDFGGQGKFTVDIGATQSTLFGRLGGGLFQANPPATARFPFTVSLSLPLLAYGGAVELRLYGAHIQFAAGPSNSMRGELHGSLCVEEFRATALPSLAGGLNGRIQMDPNGAVTKAIEQAFDIGDGNGHSCQNPAGGFAFPGDGRIDVCELIASPAFTIQFGADLQIFSMPQCSAYAPNPMHSAPDSISFGIGFTAFGASF